MWAHHSSARSCQKVYVTDPQIQVATAVKVYKINIYVIYISPTTLFFQTLIWNVI